MAIWVWNNELVQFLQDAVNDENEAEQYIASINDTKGYEKANILTSQDQGNSIDFDPEKDRYMKAIDEFRSKLLSLLEPFGDSERGYEINKTQEEVHEILINLKSYHYEWLLHEDAREYSLFFYNKLVKKGTDEWYNKLIKYEESLKANSIKPVSGKKGGKRK